MEQITMNNHEIAQIHRGKLWGIFSGTISEEELKRCVEIESDREIKSSPGIWGIESGLVRVDFYSKQGEYISSQLLCQGDILLLQEGSAKFASIGESKIIENEIKETGRKVTSEDETLPYMVLNIVDHCNLNCKGCDHFAPIAKDRCIPIKSIEKDISRLSHVIDRIDVIGIMGGEPLLHDQLPGIIRIVRKYYPEARIQVDTNGILLCVQGEEFWRTCREENAVIVVTKYPIKIDFDAIWEKAKCERVDIEYYGNTGDVQKTLHKVIMNPTGNEDPEISFGRCFHARECVTLLEGRLYTCSIIPNIHIFNEYFGGQLDISDKDYIDIYKEGITKKEIFTFLSHSIPFCRYCNVLERQSGLPYELSKKELSEWTKIDIKGNLRYEVHLTEHCNLNCAGCFHFSSIADKEFLDVERYKKDVQRLSQLYDGKAERIWLLGGEPLLHPEIEGIIEITRDAFPIGEIAIVTNGLLLLQMKESFWDSCQENNVIIRPTKYPVSFNYEKAREMARNHGVKWEYFNDGNVEKKLIFWPMDVSGGKNKMANFYNCYRANTCVTLRQGRLYTCIIPAHIHHLAKKFGLDLPSFEQDGINIYGVNSAEEINRLLTQPIEACRYCDCDNKIEDLEWKITCSSISEWVKC